MKKLTKNSNKLIINNKDLPIIPLISKQFDEAAHSFDYSYIRLAGEVQNSFISEYSIYNGIIVIKEQIEDFKEYISNYENIDPDKIIKNLVWEKAILLYIGTLVQDSRYICLPEI